MLALPIVTTGNRLEYVLQAHVLSTQSSSPEPDSLCPSFPQIPTWIVYILFNLLFLGAFIGSLLVVKLEKTRDSARSAITAATFFLLVGALGYYGFRVWRILLNASNPDPKLHGISAFRLFVVTLHIMVIYLSRAIYAILSDVVPSLRLYFGSAGESMSKEILSCLYVAIWEIVPIVVILILFWSVRNSSILVLLRQINRNCSHHAGHTEN